MPQIEFLDAEGHVVADEPPRSPARWRDGVAGWSGGPAPVLARVLPPVLWIAAAAVAVVSSFQRLWALGIHGGSGTLVRNAVDGWGREIGATHSSAVFHGPRYGIVLCTAAALLVLGAVLALLRPRPAPVVALAGGALLAGAVASAWLDAASTLDGVRAELSQAGTQNFSGAVFARLRPAGVDGRRRGRPGRRRLRGQLVARCPRARGRHPRAPRRCEPRRRRRTARGACGEVPDNRDDRNGAWVGASRRDRTDMASLQTHRT